MLLYVKNSNNLQNFKIMDSERFDLSIPAMKFGTEIVLNSAVMLGVLGIIANIVMETIMSDIYLLFQSSGLIIMACIGHVGVSKKKPLLLLPFVWFSSLIVLLAFASLGVLIILYVCAAYEYRFRHNKMPNEPSALTDPPIILVFMNSLMFCGICGVVIGGYFITAIPYRYYCAMKRDDFCNRALSEGDSVPLLSSTYSIDTLYQYGSLQLREPVIIKEQPWHSKQIWPPPSTSLGHVRYEYDDDTDSS